MPVSFWGRVSFLLQEYWKSYLAGAGTTLLIALVATFIGVLIGLLVGIIQTIPVEKTIIQLKKEF